MQMLCFYIQNNGYAISTPREKQTAAKHAQKAVAAEFQVFKSMEWMGRCILYPKMAREWTISGNGPVLIETTDFIVTDPIHYLGTIQHAYRTKDTDDEWQKKIH